jgi:16S rRNA (adenine1518-N6/adenine1519-N6)-dimethyltransferase
VAHGYSSGIPLKKKFGQHFLRDEMVIHSIIANVRLTSATNVFEIGCGDGVLTRAILDGSPSRLWVFEIDSDWVRHVRATFNDQRLTVYEENILDVDWERFKSHAPWMLLANLPYQVTFPILHMLQRNRRLLSEGVIMVQEEVAQKLLKTSGKGYGYPSLFFQHFFDWKKLDRVAPGSFYPPPKVYSRLLHFVPKQNIAPIEHEPEFWKFIKICFKQPRRTLKNNLQQSHYDWSQLSAEQLALRSQQMGMPDFLALWQLLGKAEGA